MKKNDDELRPNINEEALVTSGKKDVNTPSQKAAGTLVYRNVSKEDSKKITKFAEEVAEKYGVLVNIIEK